MPQYPYIVEERDGVRHLSFPYHEGQRKAWESDAKQILVLAGRQGGKTTFAPWWLLREIQLCKGGSYLFVTPTLALLKKQALPAFLHLFENLLNLGTYNTNDHIFTFSREGKIEIGLPVDEETKVFFGYATKADSLESLTARAAVLDECGQNDFRLTSYEAIRGRLAIHGGRILMTTTPYSHNWLKRLIYDRQDGKEIFVTQFASSMNPGMPKEELERIRNSGMPGWRYRLFYDALWERPAGLIYDVFDKDVHTMARFPIPPEWERYMGVDFGSENMAAVYLAAEQDESGNRTGRYICYRTYRAGGNRPTTQHVESMLKAPQSSDDIYAADGIEALQDEPRMPTAWGGAPSEDNWRMWFYEADLDIYKPPYGKSVETQINCTYSAFSKGELIIFDDLYSIINDLHTYSRKVDDEGNTTEAIQDKDRFHLLDSLRYAASGLSDEVELKVYNITL